jgi:hypothetical protein
MKAPESSASHEIPARQAFRAWARSLNVASIHARGSCCNSSEAIFEDPGYIDSVKHEPIRQYWDNTAMESFISLFKTDRGRDLSSDDPGPEGLREICGEDANLFF